MGDADSAVDEAARQALSDTAADQAAGFLPITQDFLTGKFRHTPSPSENKYVHLRPSRGPLFTIDSASTTGDTEHLMSCHSSKLKKSSTIKVGGVLRSRQECTLLDWNVR